MRQRGRRPAPNSEWRENRQERFGRSSDRSRESFSDLILQRLESEGIARSHPRTSRTFRSPTGSSYHCGFDRGGGGQDFNPGFPQKTSDHALIKHGGGDFAEASNVRAGHVVDEAVGFAKANALVVDCFHNLSQPFVHILGRPLLPEAVL